jgi:hypothetical protein
MSAPGQPSALDADKQKTVCALVTAGVSLRQAAHFVDCDPKTIRREAQRNDEFRQQLARAKSKATIHPLKTLRQAAKSNWRAALCWMERLDPERFARHNPKTVTQREANEFVANLIESIERAVASPHERQSLFKLLAPAMPTAMRRRWIGHVTRRAVEQKTQNFERRKAEIASRKIRKKRQRDLRRRDLWHEIGKWLPAELSRKLAQNEDLFDPEEVFAQPPGPGPLVRDARSTYKPGSIGATKAYDSAIHDRPSFASSGPTPNRTSNQ